MKSYFNIIALTLCSLSLSCDEVFPPYTEPQEVLQGAISVSQLDTFTVGFNSNLSRYFAIQPLSFEVSLKNVHNDLLQGDAAVEGLITVNSFGQVPRVCVIPLSKADLLTPPIFQGTVSLPPGKQAVYSVQWMPLATDGKMMFEGNSFVITDSAEVFGPIDFIANAEVRIFEKIQPSKIENYRFRLYFKALLMNP